MPWELLITRPDGAARRVPLECQPVTVGRSSASDLCYPDDAGLSRRHLVVEPEADGWVARDLGSKNGTLINGARLTDGHHLSPGDRITAGHLVLEFSSTTSSPETVIFVEGPPSESPASSTLVTSLEGVLGAQAGHPDGEAAPPAIEGAAPMRALIRAGRELAGHRPLAELFEVIMDLSLEAVTASRGVLMTLECGDLVVRAARGEGFRISTAVRDKVLSERASLLVRDAQLEADFRERQSIVEQRVRSMIAVPLQTNDRVIGLIYVDAPNYVRDFSRDDLNLLTVMANVAAIRLEHARLAEIEQAERILERDLEQAAEIQRRLLPESAPIVPGADLAGFNTPCRTVGGDYFDFLPYPDGRVAVVVGDVAGKGMPAALLMSCLQARVQALAEEPVTVAGLVTRLNRSIAARCPSNKFITFFAAVLDPESGELAFCNAGHNPPLVVRRDGTFEKLEGGGIVLGILPSAVYAEKRRHLGSGDVLVLYSDGVTEATPAGSEDEFGEDRLAEVVAAHRGGTAKAILEAIRQAVTGWMAGAPAADDITLLVAKRA